MGLLSANDKFGAKPKIPKATKTTKYTYTPPPLKSKEEPDSKLTESHYRELEDEDMLQGTFQSMSDAMGSDLQALSDNVLEESALNATFTLIISQPEIPALPIIPGPSSRSTALNQWYPFRGSDTRIEGYNTQIYLKLLNNVRNSETDALFLLKNTEVVGKTIGCDRTIRLWERLNTIFSRLGSKDIPGVAYDIAGYMCNNPDKLNVYLKGISRMIPFLSSENTLQNFEKKVVELTSLFQTMLDVSKAQQDEILKFVHQVSNVTANLSVLQEVIEQTVLKVSKLDLLLSSSESVISVPSATISN